MSDIAKRKAEHLRLTIIKLGGGLIAPKDWEAETADIEIIKRLVGEIKESKKQVLVVSGSGNFGHKAVKKYGITTEEGIKKVRESAKRIGEIVFEEMKRQGFEVELIEPHKFFENKNKLDLSRTIVMYGDVVGKEIWSGEKIIENIIPFINSKIERIIQVSKEDGVWDENKKIILEISKGNWSKLKVGVLGSSGVDTTGGMLHKVEESLEIEKKYGVETWIISGVVEGRLKEVLETGKTFGTKIS